MNRSTLQQLSTSRVNDAQALLAASCWSGAYYLAGYAVELALKSCVLVHIEKTGIIFQEKKYAEKCWTHDLEELVNQSGLKIERDKVAGTNAVFAQNWSIVKDWTEASRYNTFIQFDAEKLFEAINGQSEGVLPWIKNFW